jgi:hypothetical protein
MRTPLVHPETAIMRLTAFFLLMPLLIPQAAAEGRLFYTAEQRARLEHARSNNVTEHQTFLPSARPDSVTYDGVVLRSDGHNTRWINGHAISGATTAPRFKGQMLKPGQTAADGRIYEPHQIIREDEP